MKRLSMMFALGLLVATTTSSFAQGIQIGFNYGFQASAGVAVNIGGMCLPLNIGLVPGCGTSFVQQQSSSASSSNWLVQGPGGTYGGSTNTTAMTDSTHIQGPGLVIDNTNSQFDQVIRNFFAR